MNRNIESMIKLSFYYFFMILNQLARMLQGQQEKKNNYIYKISGGHKLLLVPTENKHQCLYYVLQGDPFLLRVYMQYPENIFQI